MDPVMQTLFGNMPIEKLNAVQLEKVKNKNADVILIIGGVAVILGITAYVLYKKNGELKQRIKVLNTNSQK